MSQSPQEDVSVGPDGESSPPEQTQVSQALKFSKEDCIDPDLSKIPSDVTLTICNGELAQGQLDVASLMPPTCGTDGDVGCVVVGPAFKAADMSLATAANIKSGASIAGISGIYGPACSADGGSACFVDGASYKAAKLSNFAAGDVKTGITIAGVGGSATLESHSNCASDGGVGCVTDGTNYKAAKLANFSDANIATGITIAGVVGIGALEGHVNCSADGAAGCVVDGANYKAAKLSNFAAADVKSGTTIAGVAGSLGNCADGGSGCFVQGPTFKAVTSTDLSAGNIKDGATIGGVLGTYGPACASDGAGSCLVDGTNYKAAKLSNFVAGDVKTGITIAGVGGSATLESHSNCTGNAQQGCITTATYKSGDLTNLTAGNIKSGVTIAGQAGDYPSATYPLTGADGTADLVSGTFNAQVKSATAFEYWDSTGARQTGAGDADIAAANIASSINVFGTVGTATLESHSNCAIDGGVGCVTDGTNYKAAKLSNFAAADVKSGITIAGVAGSLGNCADGGSGCFVQGPTFKAVTSTDLSAGNIKDGATIGGVSGTYGPACASDGAGSCLVDGANYKAAKLSNFVAGDVKTGITIAGVGGSATLESHSNCTGNAQQGCITTATYKSGDLTNLTADNIKSGVTIAGQAGDYPSATYPLTGADGTADLDLATFDAKVKSATAFEWFSPSGTRYSYSGDADITAANIVSGVTIFGTSGSAVTGSNCTGDGQIGCMTTSQYKSADTNAYSTWDIRKGKTVGGKAGDIVFYKNMKGTYNNSTAPAVAGTDVWDTVDDYNNNGAFPTTAPSGWDQATGANWIMDPANDVGGGGGTASDNLCSGSEKCVFIDRITGLMWAKDDGTTRDWQTAITYCDDLNYGGYTDWRLPTQKELFQAYVDGIWSQKATNKLRAYPETPAARSAMTANDKWRSAA